MILSIPMIKAQTFTPIYSQSEDRIRLIINYADYNQRVDLWLTRAFLLKLIPTMEDCIDQYDDTPLTQEAQKQTDQKAQSKTDTSTLSMTEKEGYLVHSVDLTYHKASRDFHVVFKTETLQVRAVLTVTLLRTVLRSIFAAIPKINWGISPQWVC
jgi:hypothetical protein